MDIKQNYQDRIVRIPGVVGGKPVIKGTRIPVDLLLERRLAHFLKQSGHDVKIVSVDFPAGLEDAKVLTIAYQEHRTLITNDRSDFGELIFRLSHPHCGVILFRHIRSGDIATKQKRLSFTLEVYADQLQHFLVVSRNSIRIRKTDTAERKAA